MKEINLPEQSYIRYEENGKTITICTLRQKALHTIGLDDYRHKPYRRHGKKYYRPYRNYFYGNDEELDSLVEAGYMDFIDGEKGKTYYFNRLGIDWLGEQIGVIIHDEID